MGQPNHIEKSPFLQNMLTQEPKKNHALSEKTQKKPMPDKKKYKTHKPTFIEQSIAVLCNGICYCGGKKLWYVITPKHIRKARLIGSIKLIDSGSFIMGILAIYGTHLLYLNKKTTFISWYTSLSLIFSKFFSHTPTSEITSNNNTSISILDNNLSGKKEENGAKPLRQSSYIVPNLFAQN
jgi:hypothetical protein